jgi:hypothetical protein
MNLVKKALVAKSLNIGKKISLFITLIKIL